MCEARVQLNYEMYSFLTPGRNFSVKYSSICTILFFIYGNMSQFQSYFFSKFDEQISNYVIHNVKYDLLNENVCC